ncbi:iron complex outermembrane receptor protein [Pedobacter sp. UYP24]
MKYLYSIFFLSALLLSNFTLSAQLASAIANASIRGKIKTNDGQPAASVTVQIVENNRKTSTNEFGVFVFNNVKSGEYTIKTSSVGLQVQTQKVTVTDGVAATANFTLTESGSQLDEIVISTYKSPNVKSIIAGKIAIPSKDLPQAVQIIGTQVIADQQANRLSDVLKNVNGVAYGENRGGVSGETFFARGYSLGGNNVFKNGARTSTGGMPETSTLESVEVLKGSAALLYGGVSGGAVVNLVTKKPKFENGGEISFRTGSYDLYKPSIDLYGPISKKLAFRAIGTYEKAGSYRNSVHANRVYVNPSLLYKLSDKTDILLQGDYLKSDYTPDFGIGTIDNKIVNIGRGAYLNAPWAYNNTNTVSSQLSINHQFNENWKINVLGSLQSYNRDYFSAERPFANAAGVALRNVTRSKTEEFTYNQQVNLNGEFNTGNINHKLLVGADADQSKTTSNGFVYGPSNATTFNYGSVNLLDPSTFFGSGVQPDVTNTTRTKAPIYRMGAFVQDLVTLTEQFKVLAGIRYTFQKTPATTVNTLATHAIGKGSAAGKTEKAFSPKVALIYQPLKTTSVYVSYANSLIANTGLDIYGATLNPSLVDQYEAGIKNDFLDGKLTANVTAYSIKNSNFAQQALVKADGTGNGDSNIKELNGKTLSDGVEFDLTGTILPGLNFMAGYSYNFIRYTETRDKTTITYDVPVTAANPTGKATTTVGGTVEGQRLVATTKNTANGSVFYTLQDGSLKGLKFGASAYYTGNRNGGYNDTKTQTSSRLIPLSDFTTFDISGGYSWKKLSLLAKISNITNELNYFAHENYSINPIAPRQFITTLSYKF